MQVYIYACMYVCMYTCMYVLCACVYMYVTHCVDGAKRISLAFKVDVPYITVF